MVTSFIVGDQSTVETLSSYMNSLPVVLRGHNQSLISSFHSISILKPDVIYMDFTCIRQHFVEFDLLKRLYTIIIISDKVEDAFEAFEHQAFDYLLKPLDYKRFILGIEKYQGIKMRASIDTTRGSSMTNEYFFIKVDVKGFKEIMVKYDDLLYVEAMQNYILLHIEGGKDYLSYTSLKEMEEYLPQNLFSRIHKSYIINDSKIISIEGNTVLLNSNEQKIFIGNTYRKAFLEKKKRKMPRGINR